MSNGGGGGGGGGAVAGWTDQAVLERLLMTDVLGARSQRRVLLLPTVAFNTEAPFYEAFHNRRRPAVLHLMGASPRARCRFPRMALNDVMRLLTDAHSFNIAGVPAVVREALLRHVYQAQCRVEEHSPSPTHDPTSPFDELLSPLLRLYLHTLGTLIVCTPPWPVGGVAPTSPDSACEDVEVHAVDAKGALAAQRDMQSSLEYVAVALVNPLVRAATPPTLLNSLVAATACAANAPDPVAPCTPLSTEHSVVTAEPTAAWAACARQWASPLDLDAARRRCQPHCGIALEWSGPPERDEVAWDTAAVALAQAAAQYVVKRRRESCSPLCIFLPLCVRQLLTGDGVPAY